MVRTLLWAARTDQPGHVVADVLRQAGAKNWSEGFPGDEYASVAHALVQTVRYLTPDDWSTSTGSAWVSFFVWATAAPAGRGQVMAGVTRRPGRRG